MGRRHDAELRALREAIRTSKVIVADAAPAAPSSLSEPPREESELLAALRELKDGLVQAAESADDIIETHPVASVGAAFLLGLAVGRLTRGL